LYYYEIFLRAFVVLILNTKFFGRRRRIKIRNAKILICMVIIIGLITVNSDNARVSSKEIKNIQTNAVMDGYKILSLFSFNFVSAFINVLPAQMSPFGVTTDIVAPVNSIEDHEHISYSNIDYLCSEVNVSDYDILWLPGEWGTDNLTLYSCAYDLIVDAYNEGLVLVGYNYGPIAFAHVNIVTGKNISGSVGIQSDVESAGGTYIPISAGVVVDLPFITTDWEADNREILYYYVGLALGFDLLATETPTTTPTEVSGLSITSLVFIVCLIFCSFLYKKKRS